MGVTLLIDRTYGRQFEATDSALVRRCGSGDKEAWRDLVGRYQRLIYSIPRSCGASADEAADIFLAVCAALVSTLPRLKGPGALRAWLLRETRKRTTAWMRSTGSTDHIPPLADIVAQVSREQVIRDAVADLPESARALVERVFFTWPTVPCAEVARRLDVEGRGNSLLVDALNRVETALREAGL